MTAPALGLKPYQQELRATGIGASEVAAVLGLDPRRRPIDVYAEKTGEAAPFAGNAFTEWGHRIERVVAEAWKERHPDLDVFTPGTLRHRSAPHLLASPDRIVVPRGRRARDLWIKPLEIKNVIQYRADEFGDDGTDEIPEPMMIQVQTQLEVTELPEAELVPLIGGFDFRSYPIKRDAELGGLIVEGVERFWKDHVEARVPPPVEGTDSYAEYLRARFPRHKAPLLPATPEATAFAIQLREARAAKKQAEAQELEAKVRLAALLADAEGFEGLLTFRANKDGTATDWEAIARDVFARLAGPMNQQLLDEVIQAHTTTKPGARVMRLAKEK